MTTRTYMISISPEKRTKGRTWLGGVGPGYKNPPWTDIYGACMAQYQGAIAEAATLDWSGWSAGNSGSKRWSGELYWWYTGIPTANYLATRADCSILDVQFRWLIPDTPSGVILKEAYFFETLALSGAGTPQMIHAGVSPGSYFEHSGSYTPGSNPGDGSGGDWHEPASLYPPMASDNAHWGAWGGWDWTLTVSNLYIIYEYEDDEDEPDCDDIGVEDITDEGAVLDSGTSSHWKYGKAPTDASYIDCTLQGSTNTVTKSGHGLSNGNSVILQGSLPSPLKSATVYYVVNKTDNTFQLSITEGGSAIDISTDGSGKYGVTSVMTSDNGILASLDEDTWYWFTIVYEVGGLICTKTFWFKTKKHDDWSAYIITLPATEVWATMEMAGATIHGLLDYTGDSENYLYLGFQWGTKPDVSGEPIHWYYSGTFSTGKYPIQAVINNLWPDITYYFRACLHVGTPPMNVNNYFGDTLSFGGPQSLFGEGREFITAKKGVDDVSKFSVGRYYMTKSGQIVYENRFHRES